jgi:enterobactin synthetase component D
MYSIRPNPQILPGFAVQVSVIPNPNLGIASASDLPADLRHAVAKRRIEFAAGRYCAREAIARLDHSRRGETPGRGADGAPTWPEGLTGSITHTDGFVAAAVAFAGRIDGLGIDTERILTADIADEVAAWVACPGELDRIASQTGLGRATDLSLCFSAKESLFKCLHPLVRRFFDYLDAEITQIGPDGDFTVCLRTGLNADLPAGLALQGRYAIDPSFVHTGLTFQHTR